MLFGELLRLGEEGVAFVDVSPEGLEHAVRVVPRHVEQAAAADGEAHLNTMTKEKGTAKGKGKGTGKGEGEVERE